MDAASQAIQIEEGKIIIIPWEDIKIEIPFDFKQSTQVILYKTFRNMQREIKILKTQIEELGERQNQYILYKFKEMSNEDAKKLIVDYLEEIKKDVKQVTIFEISQCLKLPADQVEEIVEELEKENQVKFL